MTLIINGEAEQAPAAWTIAELVAAKGLAPGALVVELNRTIIKQEQWPTTELRDNDRLELLSFVGGG